MAIGFPCDHEHDGLIWQLRALRESLISNGMLAQPQHRDFVLEVIEVDDDSLCLIAHVLEMPHTHGHDGPFSHGLSQGVRALD